MTTRTLAPLLALLALLAAACGTETTTDLSDADEASPPADAPAETDPESEAADPRTPDDEQADSGSPTPPEPVAEMRDEILAAARAGDYERLAELGLEGRFTASFGGDYDDPQELAEYWRREDENEGPDMDEVLIGLLGLDHFTTTFEDETGDEVRVYLWPRAHREDATAADRRELEDVFGKDTVDFWHDPEGVYLGWRLGITAEGDWQFFVAGD